MTRPELPPHFGPGPPNFDSPEVQEGIARDNAAWARRRTGDNDAADLSAPPNSFLSFAKDARQVGSSFSQKPVFIDSITMDTLEPVEIGTTVLLTAELTGADNPATKPTWPINYKWYVNGLYTPTSEEQPVKATEADLPELIIRSHFEFDCTLGSMQDEPDMDGNGQILIGVVGSNSAGEITRSERFIAVHFTFP